MEIERKYLVKQIPTDLSQYAVRIIEQAYLSTEPIVRVRRDNDLYELTYKSKGLITREEHNMPLTPDSYAHLLSKADGRIISKKRYMIPYKNHIIELDVFEDTLAPLVLAEVEFDTIDDANSFTPPSWFGEDVSLKKDYHNSNLSKIK